MFEFLAVPDFFINEETKEIDEASLVSKIQFISPQITVMMICYSQFLDLKSLLEENGLFFFFRMNRDLNILSSGQILTMNDVQKEFMQTLTLVDHVEKDLLVTGPVGSGKTLLGLEAINIKKAHYKKKYGITASELRNKIRVILLIGTKEKENLLKQQLSNMYLEIHTEFNPNSGVLDCIFQDDKNFKAYNHTLIMFDEIFR